MKKLIVPNKLDYSVVDLRMKGDWVTMTYRTRIFREWLKERNIPHLEMHISKDDFPHTILMPDEDAVAFKLKFGL